MKGYSFRSLTDLVLKIFKTKVNAGTGLSGGGSLEADRTLAVKYGTAAGTATQGNDSRVVNAASNAIVNAKEAALEDKKADKAITITAGTGLSGGGTLADNRTLNVSYGTAAGTAAQGDDSRLSDSREWTAATISQAESEVGTATTRRAFTAQRVRQAIVAWWNSITGVFGRDLVTSANSTVARSKLGLGTTATRDVGESSGQVMQVGAFGLGSKGYNSFVNPNDFDNLKTGFYSRYVAGASLVDGWPVSGLIDCSMIMLWHSDNGDPALSYSQHFTDHARGRTFFRAGRGRRDGKYEWKEVHHTGNILQSTGTSTEFSMSQKAVTDQLVAKAALSHTHPWSQVTGQPATATRWPAFAEVTGKPDNYPTTWNSVVAKPAQATRWPTFAEVTSKPIQATRWPSLAEVTDKPTNYPTNWATVSDKPIVQSVGTSTTNLMSQKAITDALGQPSMTGSATLDGSTDNTIQLTNIVSTLGIEVGDVIRIQYSGYDKLHSVESIANNNSIIVNYEHAGNRGNGSLKLANRIATVIITRIAKWFNAPLGLGQAPVTVTSFWTRGTIYTNTSGRAIQIIGGSYSPNHLQEATLYLDGKLAAYVSGSDYYRHSGSVYAVVRAGGTHQVTGDSSKLNIRIYIC